MVRDRRSVMILFGLAESRMDHTGAMKFYAAYRQDRSADDCSFSHDRAEWMFPICPTTARTWTGCSAERRAFQLRHTPPDTRLQCPRRAERAPAAEFLQVKWATNVPENHRLFYAVNKVRLAVHDGDADAFEYASQEPFEESVKAIGIVAAVNAGKPDAACEMAAESLVYYARHDNASALHASAALYALAAAAASGDDKAYDQLLMGFDGLPPEKFEKLLNTSARIVIYDEPMRSKFSSFLRKYLEDRKAEDAENCFRLNHIPLLCMVSLADLTRDDWNKAVSRMPQLGDQSILLARGFLRLGLIDEAAVQVSLIDSKVPCKPEISRAYEFLKANAGRLDGDWSMLKGTLSVFDGKAKGSLWAVRWDDRTFYIDPAGKVAEVAGLEAGERTTAT